MHGEHKEIGKVERFRDCKYIFIVRDKVSTNTTIMITENNNSVSACTL